ncbi:MAG: DUF853 family protein [Fimbriimonadaceae bacterium]|nr:DUF853 family protein [Fimbriimonadaceae bacterium]
MDKPLHLGTVAGSTAPLQIEAADLVTHAVCVGMTGSGKTGLCLVLLEELGRQNVPVVAVDTKGDLTNLALLFPDFDPAAFAPWVGAGGEDASAVAARWQQGLAGCGLSGADLAALRQGSPRRLYTPGADAGTAINILSGLQPPQLAWSDHAADLRNRISTTITALLGLVGVEADPLASPEHLLLSHLLEQLWQAGQAVSLEALIAGIQQPPFAKIGAFEVDTVLSPKDRLKLALQLNQLLASPTFQAWQTGAPLAPELFLPGADGRAPTSILYLAHLQEAERHFFLTLFLEMVSSWMRSQPGSRELRLLIYLDEVLGYLPPHPANPPTKLPLLTLFKQARAFGVGVAVATQNPVDIDYKALTNAGTWLVGRLQTEQDRARLGETLEAAAKGAGRTDVAAAIAGLEKRQFLVTSPSLDQAAILQSRFAMSYLAGPLTLPQLRALATAGLVEAAPAVAPPAPRVADAAPPPAPAAAELGAPPPAPPAAATGTAIYCLPGGTVPQMLCCAQVGYTLPKAGLEHDEELWLRLEWGTAPGVTARVFLVDPAELSEGSPAGAVPPAWSRDARALRDAARAVAERIYAKRRLRLLENRKLGLTSAPGESAEEFAARCRSALSDQASQARADLRERYSDRLAMLERRLAEEQRQYEQAKARAGGRTLDSILDIGAALLGGGRRVSRTLRSVGRVASRTQSSTGSVQDQLADVEAVQAQIDDLLQDQEADEAKIEERLAGLLGTTEEVDLAPRKQDIEIIEVALVWAPAA